MATRTIKNTATNWNVAGSWDEGAVPTSADDVVCRADGTSGNITVTAAAACKSLNLNNGAGYAGTLTVNATFILSVSGSITLTSGAGATAGAGTISMVASGTLTSNSKSFSTNFTISGSGTTCTLADTATVVGLTTLGNATATQMTAGAGSLFIAQGGLTMNVKHILNAGVTLRVTGGTMTGSATSGNSFTGAGSVEIAGNVTFAAIGLNAAVNLIYTSGIITGGSLFVNGTMTITGGITVPAMTISGSIILTLTAPITVTGTMINLAGTHFLTMAGGQTVTVGTIGLAGGAPSRLTITRDVPWVINSISTGNSFNQLSLLGAVDQTVGNIILIGNANWLTFQSGQRLTVTGTYTVASRPQQSLANVFSSTPGSQFELAFGPSAVIQSIYTQYDDVKSVGKTIYNLFGIVSPTNTNIFNIATNGEIQSASSSGYQG